MKYLKNFEPIDEIKKFQETTNTQFSQLIGKVIDEVYISEDESELCFVTEDKEYHCYKTEGDCCNLVWFSHFNGIDFLTWQRVVSVESRDWKEAEVYMKDDSSEEACMWILTTRRGYVDIEVRNSHNGYYGGSVNYHLGSPDSINGMRIITDDF